MNLTLIAIACGVIALIYGIFTSSQVLGASAGNQRMQEVSGAIMEGAKAYLGRQYTTIGIVGVVVAVLIFFFLGPIQAIGFALGAVLSGAAGYVGMNISVRSNVRTAEAARTSLQSGLTVAFRAGAITGMLVAGLALLAISVFFYVLTDVRALAPNDREVIDALVALAFGASLISIFARLGGGIFTKAADVGADLVGKVEAGIPEDDPRNAATIADNVGDNVGDCAGMAADLFESYAVMLVAALIMGQIAFGGKGLVLPLIIGGVGVISAVIGILTTKLRPSDRNGLVPINRSFFIAAAVSLVLVAIACFTFLPSKFSDFGSAFDNDGNPALIAFLAVLIGVVLAVIIQQLTGYFTDTIRRPTIEVAKTSLTGAATVILSGVSLGLESGVYTAVIVALAVFGAFLLGSGSITVALFAVALAGCGLLTTVGVIVMMDTFGPVSDNAQGVAEMSGEIDEQGARVLTDLDAVGNTTKAITKGIAIATAVLAATALFGSYGNAISEALAKTGASIGSENFAFQFDLTQPNNLVGVMIGAAVVFLFSGLAISAVGRAAGRVVYEVRDQFHKHPGIMDFTEKPDYSRAVDICTKDSLRELATPGLLAIFAPVCIGFAFGVAPLAGYLVGAIAAGMLMAVFLANSGGAWDNAKKLVEDGHHGGKGSDAHEATVIGDTVGDPFKDTAGPAINPLIKVMNLVAVLIAPAVVKFSIGDDSSVAVRTIVAVISFLIIAAAIIVSKRRVVSMGDSPADREPAETAAA
jgi:K(+)-stimulated pyrophosphate-energized sodium pump